MTTPIAELGSPDYIVLIGYFVIMLGIGAYFWRYMKGLRAYFSGHNLVPWWLSGVSFYMTSFSAFLFVAYSQIAYEHGLTAVVIGCTVIPAVLLGVLLFASRWRRARIDSPVEYVEERYGLALRQAFGWANIPVRMIDNGLRLYATGVFVAGTVGIPLRHSIVYCGVITLLYTFAGGLWAVTVTDFVQFVVMMAGALILAPLALARVGGLGGLVSGSPKDFFTLTSPPTFTWAYLAAWLLLLICNYNTSFGLVQRYYCVRDEREAKKVGLCVAVLCLIGTPIFFLPAMAARQFFPDLSPDESEKIYATICTTLLPAGALGLMVAAMFSATMSSLSGDYNAVAAVLTNDVYKRLIHPTASDRRLVAVGRIMTLLLGLIPLGIALYLTLGRTDARLFQKMVTVFSVAAPPMAIPMLAGFVWPRASNRGAIAAFLIGVSVGLGLYFCLTPEVVGRITAQKYLAFIGAKAKENLLTFATVLATLTSLIVFSILLPATGEEKRRSAGFMAKLRIPVPPTEVPLGGLPAPFRVVGVCAIAVAILLLAITPFMGWNAGSRVNLIIALMLLLPGVYWALKAGAGSDRVEQKP